MKYKYTIFMCSEWDEDTLNEKLHSIGLGKFFVEKIRDLESMIADQNDFPDENMNAKLERMIAAGLIPNEEMQVQVAALLAQNAHHSVRSLCQAIYDAGVALGQSNYRIDHVLCDVLAFLGENK